ncbi:MAG: xanthine phosphoribosyltransferase [Rhodobacterales bacterium]|nr:xanthine phosphoribosyltransferase [Rhodobacterales bacterium]
MTTSPTNPVHRPVPWEEIHRVAFELAERLRGRGPGPGGTWTGIVAITRGGLVPAALVARALDVRLIETICISSYDGVVKGELHIVKGADATVEGTGEGWLLVDDLVDTGATARAARDMLPGAHYATLYAKPEGLPLVETHVADVPQDLWIDFPWDLPPPPVA